MSEELIRREIEQACEECEGLQAGLEAVKSLVDRLEARLTRVRKALRRLRPRSG
jgi:predicted RNase H-like nuclease (RuvC/YqgF family)